MSKKEISSKGSSPYWSTTQVRAMKDYLNSSQGQDKIQQISERISRTEKLVNEMIVINPDQLREPFTI